MRGGERQDADGAEGVGSGPAPSGTNYGPDVRNREFLGGGEG